MADIVDINKGTKKKNKPAKNKSKSPRGGGAETPARYGGGDVQPGDNSRFLRYAMASLDLPPIDISDPVQVEARINEYFAFCEANDRKPNKIGMANWLGVHLDTLDAWEKGGYRSITHTSIVKKSISIMHELWVDYMMNGKINPASGIFLGKNMFGYKDVQDVKVAPPDPLGDLQRPEDIQRRIENSIPCDYDED